MKKTFLTIVTCSILSIGLGQNSNNPCQGVTVDFTSQSEPAAGGIRFTDATQITGNDTYLYSWDFGNGYNSSEKNPFMVFDEGVYTISLKVTGPNGCQSINEKDVEFSYGGN